MKRIAIKNELELFTNITVIELTERLLEVDVDQKHIKNHLPKYFYLIDKIYSNKVFNKNSEFCKLNSRLLKLMLGSDYYKKIINNLIAIGIIELHKNHRNFNNIKESKSYRLIDDSGFFILEFKGEEYKFVSSIIQNRIKRVEKDTQTLARLYRTLSNIQTDHIDITNLSQSELMFIHQLQTNKFQTVGKKGKRVYNNFCNMPKSIRKSLKLEGQYLSFVDIVNSSMIFLSGVIKSHMGKHDITPTESTNKFFDLVVGGKVYEFVAAELGIPREESKDGILKMIFSSNNSDGKIKRTFYNNFQQIGYIMNNIKLHDYRILAHQLQQKEAEIIFRALDSIDYHKEILTLHDSLYSTHSDLELIVTALVESFKIEGINATINVNDSYNVKVSDYQSLVSHKNSVIGLSTIRIEDMLLDDDDDDDDMFNYSYVVPLATVIDKKIDQPVMDAFNMMLKDIA